MLHYQQQPELLLQARMDPCCHVVHATCRPYHQATFPSVLIGVTPVWSFLSARSSLPFSDLWNQQDIFSAARWIVSVNPRDVCVGKFQSVSSFIQTSCHQCCSLAIFSPLYTTSSVSWFHRNVWWKLWTPLLNTSLIWRNTTEQKSSHLELNLINTVTISPYWHQVVLTQFVSVGSARVSHQEAL